MFPQNLTVLYSILRLLLLIVLCCICLHTATVLRSFFVFLMCYCKHMRVTCLINCLVAYLLTNCCLKTYSLWDRHCLLFCSIVIIFLYWLQTCCCWCRYTIRSMTRWTTTVCTGGCVMGLVVNGRRSSATWNVQWIGRHPVETRGGQSTSAPVVACLKKWRNQRRSRAGLTPTKVSSNCFTCTLPLYFVLHTLLLWLFVITERNPVPSHRILRIFVAVWGLHKIQPFCSCIWKFCGVAYLPDLINWFC